MKIEPGTRFGRLTVVKAGPTKRKRATSVCRCDCGVTCVKVNHELRSGDTRSCGCLHRDQLVARSTKHAMAGTRLYRIWRSMKTRATNPNRPEAHRYVLRGIGLCRAWENPDVFMKWALSNGYADDLTIDRIDNDRGYYPGNCRWVTVSEQQSNRSTNREIVFGEEAFPTVKSAAEHFGLSRKVLQQRLNRGWSVERALKQKVRKSNGRL